MEVIRAMAATRATGLLQPIVIADEIAQVRLEPTASLVLSQGGLPIAYRAMFPLMPKAGVEPAVARPSSHEHRAEPLSRLAYLGDFTEMVLGGLEPPLFFL